MIFLQSMCRMDYLRRVNDVKGYSYGTELLGEYARKLCGSFPELTFYRLEGDQFSIICPNAGEADLQKMFDEIMLIGKKGVEVFGQTQRFTISGGAVL